MSQPTQDMTDEQIKALAANMMAAAENPELAAQAPETVPTPAAPPAAPPAPATVLAPQASIQAAPEVGEPAVNPDSEMGKRIGQFIALRNKVAEIKAAQAAALAPFTAMQQRLEGVLFEELTKAGVDSMAARGIGTVYRMTQSSATVSEQDAFKRHVIGTGEWDLLDFRCNKTGVKAYIAKNGAPPPGVNFQQRVTVGVRSESSSAKAVAQAVAEADG